MFKARFPADVTAHHINPIVRYATREINRAERYIYLAAGGAQGRASSIENSILNGTDLMQRDIEMSSWTGQIATFSARRSLAYEFLAEAIGGGDDYLSFLGKYPPQEQD